MDMSARIAAAQIKVDAIDKRIDIVRAAMCRMAKLDPESFDYETEEGRYPINPGQFFVRNDEALADMKRLAEPVVPEA